MILPILMFLSPHLRSKLVWAQGLKYKMVIQATLDNTRKLMEMCPSAEGTAKGTAIYKHRMAGSCITTRLIIRTYVMPPKARHGDTQEQQASPVPPPEHEPA